MPSSARSHDLLMPASRAEKLALGCVALIYVFLSFLTYDHIEEDAFVYFRQAVNVADGHGFVFNVGGEPVEVGSSALWLLLLVALERLSFDLVLGAKLVGWACGVGTLVLTHRLASTHIRDRTLRLLPSALLAVSTPFVMNNQRGLETPLFALLVLGLCVCCSDKAAFRHWWIVAALLLPARPEGFFNLLALLPVFWMRRREWRSFARGSAALAAIAVLLLAVRFYTFHDFVPNPFYIKMRVGGWLGATRVHWLFFGNFIYFFAIPLLFTLRDRSFWNEQRLTLASFIGVQVVWTVLAKDYMPYYRHMSPAMPLIYVLLAAGLERFGSKAGSLGATSSSVVPPASTGWPVGAVGAVFVLATLWSSQSVGYFQRDFKNPVRTALGSFATGPLLYGAAVVSKMREPLVATSLDSLLAGTATIGNTYQCLVGEFLRRNYKGGIIVIYDQMGQTPFYAGKDKTFIDSWGLTDRNVARSYFERHLEESGGSVLRLYWSVLTIARDLLPAPLGAAAALGEAPGTAEDGLDYLFRQQADLILINTFLTDDAPNSLPAQLRRDPRLSRDYLPAYRLDGFVDVFERRGSMLRRGPLDVPVGLLVRRL